MTSYSLLVVALLTLGTYAQLPTLYEYYTSDGISSGLSVNQPYFTLNGKNITILSGAMHYFRIPPQYWRDRLKKLRAAGLNTVETYLAWNLHEYQNGVFDFGDGGSDMEQFLDIQRYLQMAQEEDLFVILRPGPFICAEWEWGGFPSWLLREDGIIVRTSDAIYMRYVERYFNQLLPLIVNLQFTKGGAIIAVQVENEYAAAPNKDLGYIQRLHDLLREAGIEELLVTSDGAGTTAGTIPGLLFQTVNFGNDPKESFDALKNMQPDQPLMAMEYWTGWFDHWTETHHTVDNATFYEIYETILTYPASANMYMFHGGTNFGFMNGANNGPGDNSQYQPTTTSYDYDAPLSEAGDYTGKYEIVRQLIKQYSTVETLTPDPPELVPRIAYPTISIESQLTFNDIVEQTPVRITNEIALPMEMLPINNNSGQSYGYILYRQENINIPTNAVLSISGHLRDTVMILINGELISNSLSTSDDLNGFGYYRWGNSNLTLTSTDLENVILDLIIENWGRVNVVNMYQQYKGIVDNVIAINGQELSGWTTIPLEFKKSFNTHLENWKAFDGTHTGPSLYRAVLTLEDDPVDTFIDMQEWDKGIVIVNGFVLGRYALIGPQQSLYLPGPLLQKGDNEIVVFEHFRPAEEITFSVDPIFKTV